MDAYWANVSILACINVIAALGLYVTLVSGQFSSAHAAFLGLAGYTSGILAVEMHLPLPLTAVVGVMVPALLGALLSILVAQHRGFYVAIVTLAFAQALVVIFENARDIGGADGLSGIPVYTSLPLAVVSAVLIAMAIRQWEGSEAGQSARAVGEDLVAASSIGIGVRHVKVMAFALGGAVTGFAGVLYAHYIGLVQPSDMSFAAFVILMFYVGIGGVATYGGAVVGAVVMTVLPELLRFSTYDRYLIFGLALVVMMVVRPYGLVPRRPVGVSPLRVTAARRVRMWTAGRVAAQALRKERSRGVRSAD